MESQVDNIVINYKSICLRRSDVNCFEEFNILNDMAIGFYYQILKDRNEFKSVVESVLFVEPASVSLLCYDYDLEDLFEMFAPLKFNERDLIFFPLNDNTDKYDYGAGQHWALLMYQKSNDTFYYLDSMSSFIKNADIFVSKFIEIKNYKKSPTNKIFPKIVKVLSEKIQFNSYDCGMFVLAFTESLMKILISQDKKIELNEESIRVAVYSEINQKSVKQLRKEILQIIKEIKNKEIR